MVQSCIFCHRMRRLTPLANRVYWSLGWKKRWLTKSRGDGSLSWIPVTMAVRNPDCQSPQRNASPVYVESRRTQHRAKSANRKHDYMLRTSINLPLEDKSLQNGVYTHYLIQALTHHSDTADLNADGLVDVTEAHDFAQDKTVKHTGGLGTTGGVPHCWSRGDLPIRRSRATKNAEHALISAYQGL